MRRFLMSQAVLLACWFMGSTAMAQQPVAQSNGFGACASDCCAPTAPCCPKLWGNVEYIHWWSKQCSLPSLVTQSTDPLDFGILGGATTTSVYGGNIFDNSFSGVRANVGIGFGSNCSCCCWGFETGFFFLGQGKTNFNLSCDETVTIARPFFDAVAGAQSSELVCSPLILDPQTEELIQRPLAGTISIDTKSRLWGTEANLTQNCWWDPCGNMSLTLLYGFRYLSLTESVNILEVLQTPDTDPVAPGEINIVSDRFGTRNRFYGAQIGARLERKFGCFAIEGTAKIGFGVNRQHVSINGGAINIVPDEDPVFLSSGLLAATSNIGEYSRSRFSMVYELGVNVGYYVTDNIKVYGGYNFLGWSHVVRPCHVIDTRVNPDYAFGGTGENNPEPRVPAFTWKDSNYWVHGFTGGVSVKF